MKYTINGFSQEAALSMQATVTEDGRTKVIKLDAIDLLILRWIVDFFPLMKKTIIDGTEYVWVNYDAILEDMPLLNIGKRAIFDRLKKMETLGVLKHQTVKVKGTFAYYALGPEYPRLVRHDTKTTTAPTHQAPSVAQAPSAAQDPWGGTTNADTTQFQAPADEPQPLVPEPRPTEHQDKPDDIKEIIDHLNTRLGTHYRPTTQATRKLLKARLKEGFTVEEIKLVIDKKATEWLGNATMEQYLRPETLFGNKFESYLNARIRPQARPNTAPIAQDSDGHVAECTRENGWF